MNILFLGGAKRVSMARMFKDAARRLGHNDARIFSYEIETRVPISCEAEVIVGKRWRDPEVYADLHDIVTRNKISVIVPFVDGAVGVAAEYAVRYPGEAFVPASSRETAEMMFDKVRSAEAFENAGLPIPHTYRPGEPCLRLIAKPRHGSASKGIISISSIEALSAISDDYLVQERIDNREEYTVDCYASVQTGEPLVCVPRLRIEVVGGEVSRTATFHSDEVEALARRTILAFNLRGAITIQMLRDLDDNRLMLMEINPRLGGGAVCSVHAGADLPRLILSEAAGLQLQAPEWHPGVEITRYQQEVVFGTTQN